MRSAPLALFFLTTGCVVHVYSDADTVAFDEPVSGVVTDLGAGSVTITGADTVGAVVYRSLEWSGERAPEVTAVVEDGILYLSARCEGKVVCSVDHEVIVSEDIWSDIKTGSGDVSVRNLDQGATIETGSGDLSLSGVYGNVSAETGSGEISIDDGIGDLDLSTGSGDVVVRDAIAGQLFLSSGSGEVEASITDGLALADLSTGSGDVTLRVPAGSYALDISTGSGDVELSNITQSSSTERRLEISTGSGDVRISGQ